MIPIDLSIISLDELREQCQYKIIKFFKSTTGTFKNNDSKAISFNINHFHYGITRWHFDSSYWISISILSSTMSSKSILSFSTSLYTSVVIIVLWSWWFTLTFGFSVHRSSVTSANLCISMYDRCIQQEW